jgi:hypothetical protein
VPTVGIATDKPIIAAVSGWCIGGGLVMAMMCDLLVAADTARFSYPEGKVGITGGMIAGLAARIPHKVAMEMMLLGEPIDAARAYAVGLANRVVPAGTEIDEAAGMAEKIVDLAPLALAAMKRFVNDGVLPKGPAELAARYGAELGAVRGSEDAKEGVLAFREKRRPRYQGRYRPGYDSRKSGGEQLEALGPFQAGGLFRGVVIAQGGLVGFADIGVGRHGASCRAAGNALGAHELGDRSVILVLGHRGNLHHRN